MKWSTRITWSWGRSKKSFCHRKRNRHNPNSGTCHSSRSKEFLFPQRRWGIRMLRHNLVAPEVDKNVVPQLAQRLRDESFIGNLFSKLYARDQTPAIIAKARGPLPHPRSNSLQQCAGSSSTGFGCKGRIGVGLGSAFSFR